MTDNVWYNSTKELPSEDGKFVVVYDKDCDRLYGATFNKNDEYHKGSYFYVDDNLGGFPIEISNQVWWQTIKKPMLND
jgi:hypothetical protein